MRIGRWSELSVDSVCQEHEVMRDADANGTSGELGSVGKSQLRIPWSDPLIGSAIFFLWYRSILNTKTDGAR